MAAQDTPKKAKAPRPKKATPVFEGPAVQAVAKFVRTAPRKLRLVADMIRGKKASEAVNLLEFTNKRAARTLNKVLKSAIANAENNHELDVDSLVVAEAFVGKALVMKRFHARARGRASRVEKPFSNLTIVVREVESA